MRQVVGLAVAFAQHFCFQEGGEGFRALKLVPEPAVETLAVGVLPWAAGLDVEGFKASPGDPFLHGPRHELRAIVAADELGQAAPRLNRRFQNTDDVFGFHPPLNFQHHPFPAVFVQDGEPFETAAIFRLIEHKIAAPNVIGPFGA